MILWKIYIYTLHLTVHPVAARVRFIVSLTAIFNIFSLTGHIKLMVYRFVLIPTF